jgi:hypothetical protein
MLIFELCNSVTSVAKFKKLHGIENEKVYRVKLKLSAFNGNTLYLSSLLFLEAISQILNLSSSNWEKNC